MNADDLKWAESWPYYLWRYITKRGVPNAVAAAHELTSIFSPAGTLIACSCGWRKSFTDTLLLSTKQGCVADALREHADEVAADYQAEV